MAKGQKDGATIVIRREEGGEGGHHGGAWKVAYADFVTAMMAFFLLMWLLNATTEQQKRGLADYFAPTNLLAQADSGSGQPFGGKTPNSAGQQVSDTGALRLEHGPMPVVQDIERDDDSDTPAQPVLMRQAPPGSADDPDLDPGNTDRATAASVQGAADTGFARALPAQSSAQDPAQNGAQNGTQSQAQLLGQFQAQSQGQSQAPRGTSLAARDADLAATAEAALREELNRREREKLDQLAQQLRDAVRDDPALADLASQLRVEQVPEGLRIQLLDADRQSMFALGGTTVNDRSRALIARVAAVIRKVPNAVAITGHTDATPFRSTDRSNWDLSAERANVTRRILVDSGVAEARIRSVAGLAEREPLVPDHPEAAANRRVAILLLRQNPAPGTTGQ
ncbi:flagellar motor protein MotB [Roseomonas elaeocarpi]|uniref:Flagellar motor protein MotB n=1 Tax=Roseomonas elaeocarpi TaxID=907779 RepID=A0ABV6JWB6_9PROT